MEISSRVGFLPAGRRRQGRFPNSYYGTDGGLSTLRPERAPSRHSKIGGVKGHNMSETSFPGSPAFSAGSFTPKYWGLPSTRDPAEGPSVPGGRQGLTLTGVVYFALRGREPFAIEWVKEGWKSRGLTNPDGSIRND